jgi:hypothetical protein
VHTQQKFQQVHGNNTCLKHSGALPFQVHLQATAATTGRGLDPRTLGTLSNIAYNTQGTAYQTRKEAAAEQQQVDKQEKP